MADPLDLASALPLIQAIAADTLHAEDDLATVERLAQVFDLLTGYLEVR